MPFASVPGPGRARGFTLIEVLVALAVVALALAALTRAGSTALNTQAELESRTLALWVAENRLAEIRLQRAVQPGVGSGTIGLADRDWRWRSLVEAAPSGDLWRVEVVVLDAAEQPLITHTGFLAR